MFSDSSQSSLRSNGSVKATGDRLTGVTVPQTFVERKRIEQNRQAVRQYRFSRLGSTAQRHNTSISSSRSDSRSNTSSRFNIKPDIRPTQGFSEPSGRGYNPYP